MKKYIILSIIIFAFFLFIYRDKLIVNIHIPSIVYNKSFVKSFIKSDAYIDNNLILKDSLYSILNKKSDTVGNIYMIASKVYVEKNDTNFSFFIASNKGTKYFLTTIEIGESNILSFSKLSKCNPSFSNICNDHYFKLKPINNLNLLHYSLEILYENKSHFISIDFSTNGDNIELLPNKCNKSLIMEVLNCIDSFKQPTVNKEQ